MRTDLAIFLRKITLCAITAVACSFGQSLHAHDLPNFIPYHQLGADCLGVQAPQTPANVAPPAPVAATRPRLTCPIKDAMAQAQQLFRAAECNIDTTAAAGQAVSGLKSAAESIISGAAGCYRLLDNAAVDPNPRLAARPENAPPPAPPAVAALALATPTMPLVAKNYVEDYLPYDMCIRDWRFNRFSYRGLSRTAHLSPAPIAEISSIELLARSFPDETIATDSRSTAVNVKHAMALTQALKSIEDFQCEACAELCSFDHTHRLGQRLASNWLDAGAALGNLLAKLAPGTLPAERQPHFTEPQFVVYDVAGKYFVLPVEQALAWQRVQRGSREYASGNQWSMSAHRVIDTATDAATATAADNRASADTQTEMLKFASRQLANIGQQCLQLSNLINSYSDERVAARAAQDVR